MRLHMLQVRDVSRYSVDDVTQQTVKNHTDLQDML